VICLLCGDTLCWVSSNCCKNLPGMRPEEGELTFHTRVNEGGQCLFLSTSSGGIYLIDEDRSAPKNSPYMNRYGETFNKTSKRWDNYFLDSENGGLQ